MKKFYALFLCFVLAASSFAASVPTSVPVKHASEILIPLGAGKQISLLDLSTISVRNLEKMQGKKMKLVDKAGFLIAQRKLRLSINADGTINNRQLNKIAAKADEGTGFHLGGFALGFLLGLIGVLIAYLIKDDKKAQRTKWAWIGFGVVFVIALLGLLL